MIPVSFYSHKEGHRVVETKYPKEYSEILECITAIDADRCMVKVSEEKTMKGKTLYAPISLNEAFDKEFQRRGWKKKKIDVSTTVAVNPRIEEPRRSELEKIYGRGAKHSGHREIDFVKNRLGVEVQFGKYAFMVYNVAAKMTIFNSQRIIDAGVEIVPMRDFTKTMSTGVSSFEQFKTDLEMRGEADIDIPVLVIGIDRDG